MDKRYEQERIVVIWSNENKLSLWQKSELAAIKASASLGEFDMAIYDQIETILLHQPIDIAWWLNWDKVIGHDLNAFVAERVRHLPLELQIFLHKKLTSFDTQEPAFGRMLLDSLAVVEEGCDAFEEVLIDMARKYRYTIMNSRTHGQEGELMTFGARILSWLADFRIAREILSDAKSRLKYSKMSGAHGKYGSISPKMEKIALQILGFTPYYGATQIIPRVIYTPVAQALSDMVQLLNKIAVEIRLNARSSRPLMREPFGKKQTGSSAMPHKRNPVKAEQIAGMARMANGYKVMLESNIETWEERDIAQSSVERVAWPDIFHVMVYSLNSMTAILSGLQVYPENMLLEIYESHEVAGSSELKEFLKEKMSAHGFGYEAAYRTMQLACFNLFEPSDELLKLRRPAESFSEASSMLNALQYLPRPSRIVSISEFIPQANLRVSGELAATQEEVDTYNTCLATIFADPVNRKEWDGIFNPAEMLHNENELFWQILGDDIGEE
ncbi:hypothetical protein HGA64_02170 [Candidatus Falkowbacteria bacterium]|nr:hypothetical protein [Candidatus Falkowbacteria bacterium]